MADEQDNQNTPCKEPPEYSPESVDDQTVVDASLDAPKSRIRALKPHSNAIRNTAIGVGVPLLVVGGWFFYEWRNAEWNFGQAISNMADLVKSPFYEAASKQIFTLTGNLRTGLVEGVEGDTQTILGIEPDSLVGKLPYDVLPDSTDGSIAELVISHINRARIGIYGPLRERSIGVDSTGAFTKVITKTDSTGAPLVEKVAILDSTGAVVDSLEVTADSLGARIANVSVDNTLLEQFGFYEGPFLNRNGIQMSVTGSIHLNGNLKYTLVCKVNEELTKELARQEKEWKEKLGSLAKELQAYGLPDSTVVAMGYLRVTVGDEEKDAVIIQKLRPVDFNNRAYESEFPAYRANARLTGNFAHRKLIEEGQLDSTYLAEVISNPGNICLLVHDRYQGWTDQSELAIYWWTRASLREGGEYVPPEKVNGKRIPTGKSLSGIDQTLAGVTPLHELQAYKDYEKRHPGIKSQLRVDQVIKYHGRFAR